MRSSLAVVYAGSERLSEEQSMLFAKNDMDATDAFQRMWLAV